VASKARTKAQDLDCYGSGTLHPGEFLSGSHFRRQVPLRLQRRQRCYRQDVELFVEKSYR